MKLLKHYMDDNRLRWEIVSGQYSVMLTTTELLHHGSIVRSVHKQSMNDKNTPEHQRAFASLTSPVTSQNWDKYLNHLLESVRHIHHGNNKECDEVIRQVPLQYARRGWNVFPLHSPQGDGCTCGKANCGKPGKHPRISEWQTVNSGMATVEGWWQQWPDANTGFRLDGLCVLDVDGAKGAESLLELEHLHRSLDPLSLQRSGAVEAISCLLQHRVCGKLSSSSRGWTC